MQKTFTAAERLAAFWSKVDRRGPEECWPWKAAGHPAGYGIFWNGARLVKAHRHAWELEIGPIPAGLVVCHRCDNPPCCNPAHMFVGTEIENRADSIAKGRHKNPPVVLIGEGHHLAKLTGADVLVIRGEYRRGDRVHGVRPLARRYGITPAAMLAVVRGDTWKHVKGASCPS
jgi:hypothetical protein